MAAPVTTTNACAASEKWPVSDFGMPLSARSVAPHPLIAVPAGPIRSAAEADEVQMKPSGRRLGDGARRAVPEAAGRLRYRDLVLDALNDD